MDACHVCERRVGAGRAFSHRPLDIVRRLGIWGAARILEKVKAELANSEAQRDAALCSRFRRQVRKAVRKGFQALDGCVELGPRHVHARNGHAELFRDLHHRSARSLLVGRHRPQLCAGLHRELVWLSPLLFGLARCDKLLVDLRRRRSEV
eukprot:2772494-Prymnesium_polylepis.2